MTERRSFKARLRGIGSITILLAFALALAATGGAFGQNALAAAGSPEVQENSASAAENPVLAQARAETQKFGLLAAAAAFGFGALGAGIAIGNVGSAAMGAIGEKPEIAGQALIFVALAEGLVVFGFITALMILGRV